jgi:hypothetical protein
VRGSFELKDSRRRPCSSFEGEEGTNSPRGLSIYVSSGETTLWLLEPESLEGIIFSTWGGQKKGRTYVEVEATGESSGGIVPCR